MRWVSRKASGWAFKQFIYQVGRASLANVPCRPVAAQPLSHWVHAAGRKGKKEQEYGPG